MPRLTILIPCEGGAADFDGTLVSVLQHRPADCEVLLVHAAPYDDPYRLRDEVQFLQAGRKAHLVELINEGIAAASGEIIHIVGCGVEVLEGWTEPAMARFDDPEVGAVSPLVMCADGTRLVAAGIRWTLGGSRRVCADQRLLVRGSARLQARVMGPTMSAGFFRRDVLQALGGFDAALNEQFADVDLAMAIQSLEMRSVCETASRVVQVAASSDRSGRFARSRSAERLFWRYAASRGMTGSLLLHPLAVASDMATVKPRIAALTDLLGRTTALLELGAVRRHEERLALARQRLADSAQERATIRLPAKSVRPAAAAPHAQRRAA